MNPCIFDFATKELSQDAFFCWLLSWANTKYKNYLNKIANNIITKIIDKSIIVEKIEIFRQKKDIDFYIIINEKIIIVFEDKVKTSFHDNQLEKYKEIMFEQFKDYEFYFVYIKNDLVFPNEKCEVEKNGYKVVDIYQIKKFCTRNINNDIYNDYLTYLKKKIFKYDNFYKIKFSLWGQDEWLGFIYHLINEEQIEY